MAGGKRIKAVTSSEVFKLFPLPSCLRRQNFTRQSFLFAGELINCLTLWSMRSNDEAAFRKLSNTSGKSHCVCVCSEHGGNTDAAIDTPIAVAPGMWSWSVQRWYQTNRGCSSGNNNNVSRTESEAKDTRSGLGIVWIWTIQSPISTLMSVINSGYWQLSK